MGHGVSPLAAPIVDLRSAGVAGGPAFGLTAYERGSTGPNGRPSLSSTDAGAAITRASVLGPEALVTRHLATVAARSAFALPTDRDVQPA